MAPTWFRQIFWTLAGTGLAYVVGVLALTIPVIQRNATYVHNVNPALWQNLSNVENFGFLHHQVQPFTIKSTSGVTLYAWHILPLHLYREHRQQLMAQADFGLKPFNQAIETAGMRLLFSNPEAQVVVAFHGNAAHVGSGHRPASYQQMLSLSTSERPVHVIAFDYRGFGLSNGTPNEEGVIHDGLAVLSALCGSPASLTEQNRPELAALSSLVLKPSQIILVGQSMGTFIATATLYDWIIRLHQQPLKALILLASFSSLPKLLDSYSIKGLTPPLLSPLAQYPFLQRWLRGKIIDKWDTSSRLKELVSSPDITLDITIMHAADDWEIPSREGYANWQTIKEAIGEDGFLSETHDNILQKEFNSSWTSSDGMKKANWRKIRHGGHNRVLVGEHFKLTLSEIIER